MQEQFNQRYFPCGQMERVTPEMATEYLLHNDKNPRKNIIRSVVEAYAQDMKAGTWYPNGEPIVFDANGDLKDGQHRLWGVVKADVPVYMFVIRGVDPEITTFNYGSTRKMSQELGVGQPVETLAGLIVTKAFMIHRPSKGIVREYILAHGEEMRRAVNLSAVGTTHAIGKKRYVYGAIYLMLRCGEREREIEQFMRVVNTQFSADRESSPAIVLYKHLSSRTATRNRHLTELADMETVLSAYNDFCDGTRRVRSYKITDTNRVLNMLTLVRMDDGLES